MGHRGIQRPLLILIPRKLRTTKTEVLFETKLDSTIQKLLAPVRKSQLNATILGNQKTTTHLTTRKNLKFTNELKNASTVI